jgi:hypothetical protein
MLLTFVSFEKIVAVKYMLFLWQYLETTVTGVQARETACHFASKECLFDLCVLLHGLHNLLFFSHEIQYFLGTLRVVPFGTHSGATASALSCCFVVLCTAKFFFR